MSLKSNSMNSSYFNWDSKITMSLVATVVLLNCTTKKESQINYLGQKPPGTVAELFAPGIVSTDSFEHSAPVFSPDGTVVLWTVVSKSYRASLLEMKYEREQWSAPHRPTFADSTADDYYPSFSPDGKKLYFSSRRKMPVGYPETGDMRIWEVERNQNGWETPVPFDTTVSQGKDYAHSITNDGTLYIASALGGGTNWNIRKSVKTNGRYTKPVLLPYSINSVDYEEGPYIAPDESFLIFESQRPEGIDNSIDLYISFKNKDGRWNIPLNMGPKINSGSAERFARLSPDGKKLFFGSTRNQSATNWGFDIYWIDASVIDELRSETSAQSAVEIPLGEELIDALYKSDIETSTALLNQWISSHSDHLDAIVIYSSILRKQRRYSEAERLLINNTPNWKDKISIKMETALVKFGIDRDDEAVKLLSPILVDGDQLRERYIYLSTALLDMGKLKISDEYFEKAMAIFPSSFPYYNRAGVLARVGEKDKAFDALNKAVAHGGYTARKDYETDPNLQSLKSDPRWKKLLEKLN
jgi:Tol biopolymer transport system component